MMWKSVNLLSIIEHILGSWARARKRDRWQHEIYVMSTVIWSREHEAVIGSQRFVLGVSLLDFN